MNHVLNTVDSLGRRIVNIVVYTVHVVSLIYLSTRATITDKSQGFRQVIRVISSQIYFTGWQALPLISVLALATGSIAIMQSSFQLSFIGGTDMIGKILIVIIVREIGPLLTALVVIARSGTAVASELGNMRVNKEIMALESMGVNPLSYIVFPRLLGGVLSIICLAFYFSMIALIGGFIISQLTMDMQFSYFVNAISQAFTSDDIFIFFLKNGFSGLIIFVVSAYQGLQVRQSPHEVPQATTKAVMNSIIYVISFNLIVTTLFYLSNLMKLGVI